MGRRRRHLSESGQTTAEYLGVLVLVLAVVVALFLTGIPGTVSGGLQAAICRILGQSCPAQQSAPRSFEPPPCEKASRRTDDNGSVRVAFVKLGRDYSFARSEAADGETKITFIDGSEVALVAGAGGKLRLQAGGRTYGGRLAADGELGINAKGGDTWVFDSPEEADEFEDWLRREKNEDRIGGLIPIYAGVNWAVEGITGEDDLPEPRITFVQVGGGAEVTGSAQLGGAGASATASAAALVGVEYDRETKQSTDYIQVDFGIDGNLTYVAAGLGGGWEGSGVVKVTRDRDGEIVKVEIVDTSTVSVDGLLDIDTDNLTLAQLMDKLKRDAKVAGGGSASATGTIVSTTTLDVTSDRDRAIVDDWVDGFDEIKAAGERAIDGGLPDDQRDALSPFGRLLYDQATVSVVEYDGDRSGLSLEAEIALGAKLGIDIGSTEESATAVNAWYLAGPEGGRRVLVPFTACLP